MLKSVLKLRHGFLQSKYHKFKITRLPEQQFVIMLKDSTTLSQLLQTIREEYQLTSTELLASPTFTSDLALFHVNQQLRQANEQQKDQMVLPMVLSNELFIYEVLKNKAHLIYGLECLQLNYTNNRNIPERVQIGIINLTQEWETAKTVSQALLTPPILSGNGSEVAEEIEELEQILAKTVEMSVVMKQAKMKGSLDELVKRISLLMGANWLFLYGVTFGLYGWDVGEPISYLTSAGVELLALLKYFDLEQRMSYERAVNEGKWMGLLNLEAQRRQQRWLHCHLRRQIY